MYSIEGLNSVIDVMAYTVKAMKEVGYDCTDIDDYIEDAIKQSKFRCLVISQSKLEECNTLANKIDYTDYHYDWDDDDPWKNQYYSSLWDDDGRYDDDFLNGNKHWDNGNIIDDVQTVEEEKEAYEGFSTCKNYYWDSSEEDDVDNSDKEIKDYLTSMHHEDDPSYDEHIDYNDFVYDPWAEDEEK